MSAERLDLSIRRRKVVAQAEREAWTMMRAVGMVPFSDASGAKWVEAFGGSEAELEEHMSALARLYRRTPPWRRAERKALLRQYISVNAMLTVGHGMETVWR